MASNSGFTGTHAPAVLEVMHAWPLGTPRPDQTRLVMAHSIVSHSHTRVAAHPTLTSCIHPLHYRPEVLDVVQQCQEEFLNEKTRKKKAQLSQSLLALLMYTAITPGRSKEYCTLQYEVHGDELPPLHARSSSALNCLHITEKGNAGFMALSDHKTSKHYGCDRVVLSGDSPLLQHLSGHIQRHRHILCAEQSHNFLFVVSVHGQHTLIQQ